MYVCVRVFVCVSSLPITLQTHCRSVICSLQQPTASSSAAPRLLFFCFFPLPQPALLRHITFIPEERVTHRQIHNSKRHNITCSAQAVPPNSFCFTKENCRFRVTESQVHNSSVELECFCALASSVLQFTIIHHIGFQRTRRGSSIICESEQQRQATARRVCGSSTGFCCLIPSRRSRK